MSNFNTVWKRISACAGQEFHTKRGLPFTYEVRGSAVVPDRTGFPISERDFDQAFDLMPLSGPGQINHLVYGPCYVYAILTDPRVRV